MGSRNATRADFESVIAFLETQPEIATPLISNRFGWQQADQALAYWADNRNHTFKILIDMKA